MTDPAYLETARTGALKPKIEAARALLESCELCPRRCAVNRLEDETGVCRTGREAWVASAGPHFGEESPLVGEGGSGTIFFTHCNLNCVFCQNYDISQEGGGRPVTAERLADVMLGLQEQGCVNINFVTPSHVVPQILSALEIAADRGLALPLVYNSGGYDRVETLALLEGVFDIYMPDFKFWGSDFAAKVCQAPDYPEVARNALIEMHRQVGDLEIGPDGLACGGLLIRHLVMPRGLAGTAQIMAFIAERLSPETYVNVMPQYRPRGRADDVAGLENYLSRDEYESALEAARAAGLVRLDPPRRPFLAT
ncbi:MAG: radical SAM protein [Desulfococcaceae bacterium]